MDSRSRSRIRGSGLLRRRKAAEVVLLAFFLNLGNPAIAAAVDAFDAKLIVSPDARIHPVLAPGNVAQVADSVIARISIDVVDVAIRPVAMVHQPYYAMREVASPAKLNVSVAEFVEPTGYATFPGSGGKILTPREKSHSVVKCALCSNLVHEETITRSYTKTTT